MQVSTLSSCQEERPPRQQLLVSVRNCAEFVAALSGGADWIDFKEPSQGALGAVSRSEAHRMLAGNHLGLPVSAALGELVDWPQDSRHPLLTVAGIEVVKLGLAGVARLANWHEQWNLVQEIVGEQGKQLAAVVYADWEMCQAPPPQEVLDLAKDRAVSFVLFDTFSKTAPCVLDLQPRDELDRLLQFARSWNAQVALAGRLRKADLPHLRTLVFDILAVRGAVCEGGRDSAVRADYVERLRLALDEVTGDSVTKFLNQAPCFPSDVN